MNVAIYLRKSRAEESDPEQTLDKHQARLIEFSKNNSYNIIEIYKEVVSGEHLHSRPEMLRLLADVEEGKYNGILCVDIDRLGRGNMSDQGIILETLKENNVMIITLRKVYNLNNELDEEYTEFETFIARRELKLIKRRMQRGVMDSVKKGCYMPNAPFGYEKTTIDKNVTLKINEYEAEYIKMIFDMYVNQGVGCQIIANTLNEIGVKPRRSEKFCRTSVRHILRNVAYTGQVRWNRTQHIKKNTKGNDKHIVKYNPPSQWIVTDGLHEPIIDIELFNKANEILDSRWHPPYNTGELVNSFAGLIVCRKCGHNMQLRPFKNVNYIFCGTTGCVKATKLEHTETAILNKLQMILNEIYILDEIKPKKSTHKETLIKALNKELSTLELQKEALHDLLEKGIYTVDVFLERSKKLEARKVALIKQIDSLTKEIESEKSLDKIKLADCITNLLKVYHSSSPTDRNNLMKSFIQKIMYYKEKPWKQEDIELEIIFRNI